MENGRKRKKPSWLNEIQIPRFKRLEELKPKLQDEMKPAPVDLTMPTEKIIIIEKSFPTERKPIKFSENELKVETEIVNQEYVRPPA